MIALELWKEWFEDDGDPWINDDYGRTYCFFCSNDDDEAHADDCIFLKASLMVHMQSDKMYSTNPEDIV